jgi:hypothetical protein
VHLSADLQGLDLARVLELGLQPGHLLDLQRRFPRRLPPNPDDEAGQLLLLRRRIEEFRPHHQLVRGQQPQPQPSPERSTTLNEQQTKRKDENVLKLKRLKVEFSFELFSSAFDANICISFT